MDDPRWRRFRMQLRRRLEVDRALGVAWYAPAVQTTPAAPPAPASSPPPKPEARVPPPAEPPFHGPPDGPPEGPAEPGSSPMPREVAGVGLPVDDDPLERAEALARLAQRASACAACELAAGRNRVVFGVGNPCARLVICGEAPGHVEDQQGMPFVGPSGELLDRQLAAIHLSRRDVYILNTVKCRPPRNRDPEPMEKRTCRPFLVRQLELIQPEVMLAVGKHGAQTLLGLNDSLGRMRGRWHDVEGVPVMVTYHPAYLLRQDRSDPAWRKTWDDLKKVRDRLGLKREGDRD